MAAFSLDRVSFVTKVSRAKVGVGEMFVYLSRRYRATDHIVVRDACGVKQRFNDVLGLLRVHGLHPAERSG